MPKTIKSQRVLSLLLNMPRARKRLLMVGTDAVCIALTMYVSISLKAGSLQPIGPAVMGAAFVATVVSMPIFARIGLYRAVVRYMGPRAALVSAAGTAISMLLLFLLSATGLVTGLPGSTIVIFGSLLLIYVGTGRMVLRWLVWTSGNGGPPVVIYGAGGGGAELAAALSASRAFAPVAFVDDNPSLWGSIVAGRTVHAPELLPQLLRDTDSHRVLLAMPSLPSQHRREILRQLEPLGVHVQTIPGIADLVTGAARVDELQEIAVTDLLGRDAVPPVKHLFESCITGKTILVSGAGGSIGSELCRQIIRLHPRRLVLLENSELALYNIERELSATCERERLSIELVPLIGNAHHKHRVREILQTFSVQTVYHAAAFKHVPIVENNVIEGLHNNVFATWHTAEAALESAVETFVLVSTDKAVNPSNVMGATKRFAELVLQGLQQRGRSTRFCMVRFGNVLDSSGSVVPLFRDQIRRGGPITVTHPDVMRYFMTIPEAAQLVIQAGSMAQGGDVFLLDMGKPIRIADLARRMILLAGLTVRDNEHPDGDIEIVFTGLRPAEKLFEELLIGKDVSGTEHPMILRAVEHTLPWHEVETLLNSLGTAMRQFDCRAAHEILRRAVAEYRPTSELHDLVWAQRAELARRARGPEAKVAELPVRRTPGPTPHAPGSVEAQGVGRRE